MYQLSATLHGHDDDVKALAAFDENTIVSGSRDSTVRIWNRKEGTKFDSSIINYKSSKFINALTIYQDDLIVSGGNDNLINITERLATFSDNTDPKYCFVGHTANICSLDTYEDLILSGSWDSTAKVWTLNGEVLYDLKGHEHSVWSVKFLSKTTFLTCGADGTIRKWEKNQMVHQFKAHEDVVRDILVLPNRDIVSCSNDTTIKIWDGKSYQLKATLIGHQNFIYSLGLLPNGDIISSGEDRSVRIWRHNQCIQAITLPCISVWKVVALSNGDIVTASSDSLVRVFSNDSSRIASDLELTAFKKELESSSISESSIQGLNKSTLPGLESLNTNEEKIEGEVKYVNNDSKIELYQWSNSSWLKIGEIVEGNSSNQKKFYNGSYYDYVFDVDIADGAPPLKLPFNLTDNPYNTAEKFLADNDLPYSYLQEVVNFILQNVEGVTIDHSKPKLLPIKSYVGFEGFDEARILGGFKKLNSKQTSNNQIVESTFETLINCQDYKGLSMIAGDIIQQWDDDSKLLGFDVLRSVINKIQPFANLFPIIKTGLDSTNDKILMMTIRVLTNTFLAKGWGQQMFLDDEIVDVIFTSRILEKAKSHNKLLNVSLSTLILNYCVLIVKFNLISLKSKMVDIIKQLSVSIEDDESAYRLLAAVGTLDTSSGGIGSKEWVQSAFERYKTSRFQDLKQELSI